MRTNAEYFKKIVKYSYLRNGKVLRSFINILYTVYNIKDKYRYWTYTCLTVTGWVKCYK